MHDFAYSDNVVIIQPAHIEFTSFFFKEKEKRINLEIADLTIKITRWCITH